MEASDRVVRALGEVPEGYRFAEAGVQLPSRTEQSHIALGRAVERIKQLGYEMRQEFEKLDSARDRVGGEVNPEFEPHVQAALEEWRGLAAVPTPDAAALDVPDFLRR